jgi:hypothetical protein
VILLGMAAIISATAGGVGAPGPLRFPSELPLNLVEIFEEVLEFEPARPGC